METSEFLKKLKWRIFIDLSINTNTYRGICEVLREIYDDIYTIQDQKLKMDITIKLVDAIVMASKMNKRLIYYQTTYKDNTGHHAMNIQKVAHCRRRLHFRRNRNLIWW